MKLYFHYLPDINIKIDNFTFVRDFLVHLGEAVQIQDFKHLMAMKPKLFFKSAQVCQFIVDFCRIEFAESFRVLKPF